jgi:hypothetical protein
MIINIYIFQLARRDNQTNKRWPLGHTFMLECSRWIIFLLSKKIKDGLFLHIVQKNV